MPTEAQTRTALIDPALMRAGWDVADMNKVGIEIPVDGTDAVAWHQLQSTLRQLKQQGVSYAGELCAWFTDHVLRQAEHLFQTLLHRSFRGA